MTKYTDEQILFTLNSNVGYVSKRSEILAKMLEQVVQERNELKTKIECVDVVCNESYTKDAQSIAADCVNHFIGQVRAITKGSTS